MGNRTGVNSFDPPSGMVRNGTIVGYSQKTNTLQVELTETSSINGRPFSIPVPAYFPLIDSTGLFIGSLPAVNTLITVAQSSGGQYYVVGYNPEDLDLVPDNLKLGEMLLFASDTAQISLDIDSHIRIGSDTSNIHVFSGSQQYPKDNLITLNFENENHFTQGYRDIGGLIKRDLTPSKTAASFTGDTKLEDDNYWTGSLTHFVGLDPYATTNDLISGSTKNPPLVEHRNITYEFQYQSNVDNDEAEANKYSPTTQNTKIFTTPNRRDSRADIMSLSLVAPNFLIEEVKGTVVDVFGNILDINRMPLPVGMSAENTLRTNGTVATTNAKKSFMNIKALERKSIAYHFEINARKDPAPKKQGSELSINDDNYNAKLQRSRFSFDIDKEGQFKLNVPASSESGNIPLLVRAENYSTFATTDSGNVNQSWAPKSGQPVSQDIFVDSFAAPMLDPSAAEPGSDSLFTHGSIKLIDTTTNADAGPTDRISQYVDKKPFNIRHGTAYHDILQTCMLHQNKSTLEDYQTDQTTEDPIDITYIGNLEDIVTGTIPVSGPGAKAGGRSGSINFDGSLEWNIGANSLDRQSLWLDTAGGIIANIGRDLNNRSAIINFDGDVVIQIGGNGIATSDARFAGATGPGLFSLDLRVFVGGFSHMFRIDSFGVTVTTPQTINLYAAQGINMKSDGPIYIDSDNLHLNHRLVFPPDSPGVSQSI